MSTQELNPHFSWNGKLILISACIMVMFAVLEVFFLFSSLLNSPYKTLWGMTFETGFPLYLLFFMLCPYWAMTKYLARLHFARSASRGLPIIFGLTMLIAVLSALWIWSGLQDFSHSGFELVAFGLLIQYAWAATVSGMQSVGALIPVVSVLVSFFVISIAVEQGDRYWLGLILAVTVFIAGEICGQIISRRERPNS
ncbi:MAG: hypothetical protein ACM3ZT_01315 [Bacillota bacterium]